MKTINPKDIDKIYLTPTGIMIFVKDNFEIEGYNKSYMSTTKYHYFVWVNDNVMILIKK